jgi:hypothetical protein
MPASRGKQGRGACFPCASASWLGRRSRSHDGRAASAHRGAIGAHVASGSVGRQQRRDHCSYPCEALLRRCCGNAFHRLLHCAICDSRREAWCAIGSASLREGARRGMPAGRREYRCSRGAQLDVRAAGLLLAGECGIRFRKCAACGRDGRARHNLGFRMLRVRVASVVPRLVGVAPTGKMVAGPRRRHDRREPG